MQNINDIPTISIVEAANSSIFKDDLIKLSIKKDLNTFNHFKKHLKKFIKQNPFFKIIDTDNILYRVEFLKKGFKLFIILKDEKEKEFAFYSWNKKTKEYLNIFNFSSKSEAYDFFTEMIIKSFQWGLITRI